MQNQAKLKTGDKMVVSNHDINTSKKKVIINNTDNVREQDISLTIDLQGIIEKEEKNKKDQTTKKAIKHELLSPQQYKKLLTDWKKAKDSTLVQGAYSKSGKDIDSTHPLKKIALKKLFKNYYKKYHQHIQKILYTAGEINTLGDLEQYEKESHEYICNTPQKIIEWLREQGVKAKEIIYSVGTDLIIPKIETGFNALLKSLKSGLVGIGLGIIGNYLDPEDKFFNTKQMVSIGVQ